MRARLTPAIGTAAVALLALTACASGTTGEGDDGPVTITFQEQFTDAQTEVMESLVEKFHDEVPGITVKLQRDNDSSYYDKLVTQITAGGGPDIARIEPAKTPQYIASGWVAPLGDAIGSPSDYFDSALEAVSKDGELYGVPFEVEGLGLFYRTDMLADAGFDAPPATWEEFRDVNEKIAATGAYGSGLFGGWGAFEFYPWLWQAGAEVLDETGTKAAFNSPEGVKALQLWVDLQQSAMPPGMATAGEDDVKGPFISGNLAMFTSGPWAIPSLREAGIDGAWAIAPLPADERAATVLGGMNLVVLENSKHPEAAKTFLGWLMKDENVAEYYKATGSVPAKVTLFDDPAFAEDEYISAFQAILEDAVSRPTVPASADVDAALGEAVQAALAGTKSAQDALDEAAAKANEALSD